MLKCDAKVQHFLKPKNFLAFFLPKKQEILLQHHYLGNKQEEIFLPNIKKGIFAKYLICAKIRHFVSLLQGMTDKYAMAHNL